MSWIRALPLPAGTGNILGPRPAPDVYKRQASQSRRTLPAGSPQAGSVFGCQGVGDDFLIAHQFRNPGAPAVKEARCV